MAAQHKYEIRRWGNQYKIYRNDSDGSSTKVAMTMCYSEAKKIVNKLNKENKL